MFQRETTMQWIFDSKTEEEKFRVIIPIDGFNTNEVSVRIDRQRLLIFAERIENKLQGLSKTIIDQSYELPSDVDHHRFQLTYPSTSTIQIDFPSRFIQRLVYGSSNYSKPRLVQVIESINDRNSTGDELQGQIPIRYRSRSGTPVTVVQQISSDIDDDEQIEMKLKINSLNPDDLQISIENNELIVCLPDHSFDRRILLPSNIDPKTLKIRFDSIGNVFFTLRFFQRN